MSLIIIFISDILIDIKYTSKNSMLYQ